MENNHHHQQHHINSEADQRANGGSNKSSNNSFHCRQSSTRWIPTSDQIRILRDLYYVNGLRSPNAEQIQRISARLRQYGKIEGKNVFYWFQNHKARERQKKRLNVELPNTTATTTTTTTATNNNKYSSGSSFGHPGVTATPCGSMSLRENCIYGGGGDGSMVDNDGMGWAYAYNIGAAMETREMETLQLFPMHAQEEQEPEHEEQREDANGMLSHSLAGKTSSFPGFYWGGSGVHHHQQEQSHNFIYDNHYSSGASASLELTLNSYCYDGST